MSQRAGGARAVAAFMVAASALSSCTRIETVSGDSPSTSTSSSGAASPSVEATPVVATASPKASPTPTATKAARPRRVPPVVAAAGDIACGPGANPGRGCRHKVVSDAILADTAIDTVLTLGDQQYPDGGLRQYRSSYDKTWGRFKEKTRPVPGNHDYETKGAAGYFDYFGKAAGERGKGYYSFDIGAWHFVALNSEISTRKSGAQVAWLKADLRANRNKCVAAYWHKPRWSSGVLHGDNRRVAPFIDALYQANADLVLAGHEHNYERSYPLDRDGARDDKRGIVQIVSGLGGMSRYKLRGGERAATKNSTSFGYTRLVLHPRYADITFVSVVGGYRDSFRLRCH